MNAFAMRGLFDTATAIASAPWKPFHPGIQSATIYETPDGGPAALLLRYEPGAEAPPHVHQGVEHILILSGSQTDELGRHEAGTLLVHGPGSEHHVRSEDGCLVLAIWERRVKML